MYKNYPNTDGLLWFYNKHRPDLNTLTIIGKTYFERFNYLYNPEYKSLWCDNELTDVGNILQRQTHIDKCIIDHQHVDCGYKKDDLYLTNLQYYNEDKATYIRRRQIKFGLHNKH